MTVCEIGGCGSEGHPRLCSTHKSRLRRWGDSRADVPRRAYTAGPTLSRYGYLVAVAEVGHPLATAAKRVLVHRLVLWEKLGGTDAPCHWCGKPLTWAERHGPAALNSDHIDGDKLNNAPENVVPCCRSCNSRRRNGETLTPFPAGAVYVAMSDVCSVSDCAGRRQSRGMCRRHYQQQLYRSKRDATRRAECRR